MLLTATQAAFNGLLELLDESLDLYQDLRERLPSTSRWEQLDTMLEQRRQLHFCLCQAAVKELQIRPRAADQDIEGLTHLLEKFRRLWQEPERVALDLLLDHEQELEDAYQEVVQGAKGDGGGGDGGGDKGDSDASGRTGFSSHLEQLLADLGEHLQETRTWLQH